MKLRNQKPLSAGIFLCLALLVLNDVIFHFDKSLVQTKRKHVSPQRDWNIFYGQRFVYYDTPIRYEKDFQVILDIVQPHSLLFSDLATSYYSAVYLPVYVRNVHRHQGGHSSIAWKRFLQSKQHCYLNDDKNLAGFQRFVQSENRVAEKIGAPEIMYVLVNKDKYNRNPRFDCFWNGRQAALDNLAKISTLLYDGEYLVLYELNKK